MSYGDSERLSLAKAMLKRTNEADYASEDTIWWQQRPEIRELWLRRADLVIEDLMMQHGLWLKAPEPSP